jgi:PAS domain S-box-containing protein
LEIQREHYKLKDLGNTDNFLKERGAGYNGSMSPPEVNVCPGNHVCYMECSGESLRNLVVKGIADNQQCLLVGDEASLARMQKEIPEFQDKVASIPLVKDASRFNATELLDVIRTCIETARDDGFTSRIIQDMSWTKSREINQNQYSEYEARLSLLCEESNAICICLYDTATPASILCDALRTHPFLVIDETLYPNWYYVPPEIFLQHDESELVRAYFEKVTNSHFEPAWRESLENKEHLKDTTGQKSQGGTLEFLAGVVENVMEAVIVTDSQGVITYVNPSVCDMFGYSKRELEGELANMLNSKNSPVTFQEILHQKKNWEGEMLAIRKNGERFPIWLRLSLLLNDEGETTAFVSVCRDITEQKEAEEKLQRYALLLEMKVREKTRGTETLLKTSYSLRSTSNWRKGIETITKGIVEGLGFDRAAIFFVNEREKTLECKGQLNMSEKMLRVKVPLKDTRYAVGRCVAEGEPLLVKDGLSDHRIQVHLEEEAGEFVWVPILFQSEVLGAIGADRARSQEPIEPEDVDMLELYANQIAEFIERTRLVVEPEVEKQVSTPLKYDLEPREVYIVEEERPEKAFDIFTDLVKHGFKGFGICRTHPQKVREKYALERTPVMWLSEIESKQLEQVGPQDIPKLTYVVSEFIKRAQPAVVILEGVEYLMVQNDFKTVLKLLHTLTDYVVTSQSILILPINPKSLPVHQHVLLRRAFKTVAEEE